MLPDDLITITEFKLGPKLIYRKDDEQNRTEIHSGTYRHQPIVAKIPSKSDYPQQQEAMEFNLMNEAYVYEKIRQHPNIARYMGFLLGTCGVVLEFAEQGDLETYLSTHNQEWLNSQEPLNFALDIALALKHIHGRDYIYIDLQPQNVLLSKDKYGVIHAKLCNFRSAQPCWDTSGVVRKPYRLGSEDMDRFKAPESLGLTRGRHDEYSRQSDLYSYGNMLFCLFTVMPKVFLGTSHFGYLLMGVDPRSNVAQGMHENSSKIKNDQVRDLVLQLWKFEPKKRPKLEQVIERLEGMRPKAGGQI